MSADVCLGIGDACEGELAVGVAVYSLDFVAFRVFKNKGECIVLIDLASVKNLGAADYQLFRVSCCIMVIEFKNERSCVFIISFAVYGCDLCLDYAVCVVVCYRNNDLIFCLVVCYAKLISIIRDYFMDKVGKFLAYISHLVIESCKFKVSVSCVAYGFDYGAVNIFENEIEGEITCLEITSVKMLDTVEVKLCGVSVVDVCEEDCICFSNAFGDLCYDLTLAIVADLYLDCILGCVINNTFNRSDNFFYGINIRFFSYISHCVGDSGEGEASVCANLNGFGIAVFTGDGEAEFAFLEVSANESFITFEGKGCVFCGIGVCKVDVVKISESGSVILYGDFCCSACGEHGAAAAIDCNCCGKLTAAVVFNNNYDLINLGVICNAACKTYNLLDIVGVGSDLVEYESGECEDAVLVIGNGKNRLAVINNIVIVGICESEAEFLIVKGSACESLKTAESYLCGLCCIGVFEYDIARSAYSSGECTVRVGYCYGYKMCGSVVCYAGKSIVYFLDNIVVSACALVAIFTVELKSSECEGSVCIVLYSLESGSVCDITVFICLVKLKAEFFVYKITSGKFLGTGENDGCTFCDNIVVGKVDCTGGQTVFVKVSCLCGESTGQGVVFDINSDSVNLAVILDTVDGISRVTVELFYKIVILTLGVEFKGCELECTVCQVSDRFNERKGIPIRIGVIQSEIECIFAEFLIGGFAVDFGLIVFLTRNIYGCGCGNILVCKYDRINRAVVDNVIDSVFDYVSTLKIILNDYLNDILGCIVLNTGNEVFLNLGNEIEVLACGVQLNFGEIEFEGCISVVTCCVGLSSCERIALFITCDKCKSKLVIEKSTVNEVLLTVYNGRYGSCGILVCEYDVVFSRVLNDIACGENAVNIFDGDEDSVYLCVIVNAAELTCLFFYIEGVCANLSKCKSGKGNIAVCGIGYRLGIVSRQVSGQSSCVLAIRINKGEAEFVCVKSSAIEFLSYIDFNSRSIRRVGVGENELIISKSNGVACVSNQAVCILCYFNSNFNNLIAICHIIDIAYLFLYIEGVGAAFIYGNVDCTLTDIIGLCKIKLFDTGSNACLYCLRASLITIEFENVTRKGYSIAAGFIYKNFLNRDLNYCGYCLLLNICKGCGNSPYIVIVGEVFACMVGSYADNLKLTVHISVADSYGKGVNCAVIEDRASFVFCGDNFKDLI